MRQVGLKFLLQGGLFIQVAMQQQQAESLIREWASGELRQKSKSVSGVCSITGSTWSVLIDSIAALHTEQLAQQPTQQNPWGGIGSGRN